MNPSRKVLEFKSGRSIAALPAEVFDAWLNPKTPGTPWNAPEKIIFDPKPDRLYYLNHGGIPHYGRFIEVKRPGRIQLAWVSPNTSGTESLVTVTFQKNGSRTLMTLIHSDVPDDELGRLHEQGWNYYLGIFPEQFRNAVSKRA